MSRIYYDEFNNKKTCMFSELEGEVIHSFKISEDLTKLEMICGSGLIYTLDGSSRVYNDSYIENKIEELDSILDEKIIISKEVDCKNDGYFICHFYNIETRNDFIQIRFSGEEDCYYGAEVEFYRTCTKNEIEKHINEGLLKIEEIKDDIKKIKEEI